MKLAASRHVSRARVCGRVVASSRCDQVRSRIADGLRVISYSVRHPAKIVELIQLTKEAAETGARLDINKDKLNEVLLGSDEDIKLYVESEIAELLRLVNRLEDDQPDVTTEIDADEQ